MLTLFKNDGSPIMSFKTYKELYKHIRDQENMKLLEDHPEFGKTAWSFTVLSPEEVAERYKSLEKRYDLKTLSRALQEKSGIIEMCQGDENNPYLVIASPGVDIEGFRKDFCDDYCYTHGMSIHDHD
jgi:hypothetical protein